MVDISFEGGDIDEGMMEGIANAIDFWAKETIRDSISSESQLEDVILVCHSESQGKRLVNACCAMFPGSLQAKVC